MVNGVLAPDDYDFDIVARDMRISVKARKGTGRGWNITSIIPRIKGEGCPTHLMFIQFTDGYLLFRVWLFPWGNLLEHGRFVEKKVRGEHRGYYVRINPSTDQGCLIYAAEASTS